MKLRHNSRPFWVLSVDSKRLAKYQWKVLRLQDVIQRYTSKQKSQAPKYQNCNRPQSSQVFLPIALVSQYVWVVLTTQETGFYR